MRKVEVTLKWLKLNNDVLIHPEDLSEFFNTTCESGVKMGDKGGIYFWIHGKTHIAYIGEAGKGDSNFKNRFASHLKATLYGQYTAVDCGDNDLFKFYACHTKYYKYKSCKGT